VIRSGVLRTFPKPWPRLWETLLRRSIGDQRTSFYRASRDFPYGVNATYMTESFETDIRATAVGGAYNIGRIGAAIAPWLIDVIATRYSIGLGLIIMAGAYFLTGIIPALFIREKMYDPQQLRATAVITEAR